MSYWNLARIPDIFISFFKKFDLYFGATRICPGSGPVLTGTFLQFLFKLKVHPLCFFHQNLLKLK